jgi:hypothetical protein
MPMAALAVQMAEAESTSVVPEGAEQKARAADFPLLFHAVLFDRNLEKTKTF